MSKISFELDETYTSKLTSLAKNATIEDIAKEIVINHLNSVNNKPRKAEAWNRRDLGI